MLLYRSNELERIIVSLAAIELTEINGEWYEGEIETEGPCAYIDCTFEGLDIDDQFDTCEFEDCTFNDCVFADLAVSDRFKACEFIDCIFSSCVISCDEGVITDCTVEGGSLGRGMLAGGEVLGCTFNGTVFFVERVGMLKSCTFEGCDLSRLILTNVSSCAFVECDLGMFTGINADDCVFDNCTANIVNFDSLIDSEVLNCKWAGIFTAQTVEKVIIEDSILTKAKFCCGAVRDLCLTRCDLAGAEFTPNSLDQVVVTNCDTVKCTFTDTPICDLIIECDCTDEGYSEHYNSKEMTFSQCNIEALLVIGADVQLSTFELCDFSSSKFRDSNLCGSLFLYSSGQVEIENCKTIAMAADEISKEDLEFFS